MHFSVQYLTVHMKDIGISIENIAFIYAALPFTSLISGPLVGFLADHLGSYTKVLLLTLAGDAIFFSLLLTVPGIEAEDTGGVTARFWGENWVTLSGKCSSNEENLFCALKGANRPNVSSKMTRLSPSDLISLFSRLTSASMVACF